MNSERNVNSTKDERARLRRNQRNSRARKQAYVQDLEKRWNECVRLGAQASVEMQREARRVQEENKLLRALLHKQGLDDMAIRGGIVALAKSEENEIQSLPLFHPSEHLPDTGVGPASLSIQNNAWPGGLQSNTQAPLWSPSLVGNEAPSDPQTSIPQGPSIDDWFADLCDIKDAFTVDLFAADPSKQYGVDMPGTPPDISQYFDANNAHKSQPPSRQDEMPSI
ncbi:hypothetical protein EKO27_g9730 [Xylaria grammica]|uniref:BZIP domain-containing protein n=1 Tax=Xylaria grammica TaxID=363999 RepID=A0A439CTC3_9PEZI|nr:hypothetical protein EKO27_g9730 [Xylaria grammica]